MRFLHYYLIGYGILLLVATAALWYGGVLQRLSPGWVLAALVVALGLGLSLFLSRGASEITRE
jgi:hypothetical protein